MLSTTVRPPALAGTFYPRDAGALRAQVAELLAAADERGGALPKVVIAPHAALIYSGPIAASAFRAIAAASQVRRVVVIGPSHRFPFYGVALPSAAAFATPLGTLDVDPQLAADLRGVACVQVEDRAHDLEHSLEIELPFLQYLLGEFQLVPLVVGRSSAEEVAEVLARVWGGPETLVVVSSDLSHFLPYEVARRVDRTTAEAVLALRGPLATNQACGAWAINGLLPLVRRYGLMPELLDLRNSGDTAGDHSQVVGYGAFAFRPAEASS